MARKAYDLGSRESSRTLGNGLTRTRSWRGDNLPVAIQAPGVVDLSCSLGANKRKTAETNNLFAPQTKNFNGYENEDRLTGCLRGRGEAQTRELAKVGEWQGTVGKGIRNRFWDALFILCGGALARAGRRVGEGGAAAGADRKERGGAVPGGRIEGRGGGGAAPVGRMNGEQLDFLLSAREIGVGHRAHEILELNESERVNG